jgi:hypothetical protein
MRTTGPGQSAYLLLDVADILAKIEVPYAVIGALAVSVHGLPRFTADADAMIWLEGTGETMTGLRDRFVSAGYLSQLSHGDVDDPLTGVLVLEDAHKNQVDLVLGLKGMDPKAVKRCVTTTLLGSPLQVLGAEDLIAMKVFAGGPQDLEDVRGILQVSKEKLDLALVRDLAGLFGNCSQARDGHSAHRPDVDRRPGHLFQII